MKKTNQPNNALQLVCAHQKNHPNLAQPQQISQNYNYHLARQNLKIQYFSGIFWSSVYN